MSAITESIPVVVAILGSGGLLGGIYALMKLRPEAGQIVVTAAQGALIVQTGVIESLQNENARLRERVTSLERQLERLTHEIHDGHQEGRERS
jgi:hypothetical protein